MKSLDDSGEALADACLDGRVTRLLDKAFDQLLAAKLLAAAENPLLTYSVGVLCCSAISDVLRGCFYYETPLQEPNTVATDITTLIRCVSFLSEVSEWPRALMTLACYDRKTCPSADWHVFMTPDWQEGLALMQALAIIDVIADHMPDALHESYCCVLKQKHL